MKSSDLMPVKRKEPVSYGKEENRRKGNTARRRPQRDGAAGGAVVEQPITATLDENYMPYAMSVIVSRAIPEIDGFKPSHRKLLYTMYKMGLLTGSRTKSANIVGQTMRLNPHGDQAIYETMVRLAKGNESLLHPFVDSKGNFGKVYSRDMAYAASRYTEAKLAPICAELFRDLDSDAVDFVDNYDNTTKEPALLPTTYPNVLVSANQGIAVGMASQICGFNLGEVCDTTIAYLKNPAHDIASTLLAPDFPTGGQVICDGNDLRAIYDTGRGGLKVRARWRYDKKENVVEVYEIPYSTTIEAILDKVAELVKAGKVKEIADMRDETDLSGLKLAIDLKRGVDPDKLMAKLYRLTPLQDTVSCNFNILIAGMPRVLGVGGILEEWTAWRTDCVKRRVYFILNKKKEKLHLLQGLKRILLDIDRAIRSIRETEEEAEVIPNLMIGFGIDQVQAEYVAEIKLRNINKEYILKRVEETSALQDEIEDLEDTLAKPGRIRKIIINELEDVRKKYAMPRRTEIVYSHEMPEEPDEEPVEDYPVHLFLSREGYFKKITPQSLRMSGEQKFKEGDSLRQYFEATNNSELLLFTDKYQVYKTRASEFGETKASALGDYLPGQAGHGRRRECDLAVPAGRLQRQRGVLLRKRPRGAGGAERLRHGVQSAEAHRRLLRQVPVGVRRTPDGGYGAGAGDERAESAAGTHIPAGAQDHPLHSGRAGDEHQAQVPAGKGASRGGMRHRQRCPLPDADHPRGGCAPEAGGQRGEAAGAAVNAERRA